jgi:hypothetical protein
VPGVAGVERKYFGSFTEHAFWIEMVKIDAGAVWLSTTNKGARRLVVALSGTALVNGTEIGRLAAIQADAGEKLRVGAAEEMVLHIVGLPPVQLPSTSSDKFDVIESDVVIQPGQPIAAAIQFEDPKLGLLTVPADRIGEERKRSFERKRSMNNALFPALLFIFAAVVATPARAQQSGQYAHVFNPNISLSAPATSPLQQEEQADYASRCRRSKGRGSSRTHPA